jgi:hypothetical protein
MCNKEYICQNVLMKGEEASTLNLIRDVQRKKDAPELMVFVGRK